MGEWLGSMIAQGHGEAEFYAGLFANVTMGGDAVARRHYLLAAAHGMPEAMAASAEMLFNGRGGAADPELARAMFEFAAARDHAGASYALGMIAGPGAMGEAHIRRAAALGHENALGHEIARTIAVLAQRGLDIRAVTG